MIVHVAIYLVFVLMEAGCIGANSVPEAVARNRTLNPLVHAHLRNYTDHRRILVRPLMHLGLSEGPDNDGYPLLYISSAFLGGHGTDRKGRLEGATGNLVLWLVIVAMRGDCGPCGIAAVRDCGPCEPRVLSHHSAAPML